MNYEFSLSTHPGLARENNEDAVAVDEAVCLGILADGMGGYNAGEVASGMAVSFIQSELGRWLAEAGRRANAREVRRAMELCVEHANRSIFNAANSNPQYRGMGTTLVLGIFQDGRLVLGHIGDSRAYRLRRGELQQITKDHSLLQEQIDAGLITRSQAATSANRNLVTRALGVEDVVQLEVLEHRVQAGDVYLLCSDGLTDMLDDEGIAAVLREAGNLDFKAARLVDAANANGGRDNISVLLVQATGSGRRKGLMARWLGQ